MKITETYTKLKTRLSKVFDTTKDYDGKPPKESEKLKVAQYVSSLWDDGCKSFKNSFKATKDAKINFTSPEDFYSACAKLEAGRHYEVFPSRTAADGTIDNSWKQELVDNEIQKQIRAKKNHITANWHDIVISPNELHLNEIFDQERKITGWSGNVREWVSYAQNFGDVYVRSVLDKNENPNGVATEILCEPGSVFRTPETKSIKKIDGCWYVIHGQRVNDNWVRENYPDFDTTISDTGDVPKFLQIDKDYTQTQYANTKMFNKLEAFCDDSTIEEIPFDKAEFDQRIAQIMTDVKANVDRYTQGLEPVEVQVAPTETDNHKKFIKEYLTWLEEKTNFYEQTATEAFNNGGNLLPEDTVAIDMVAKAVEEQINMHESMKNPNPKIPDGKRMKYPNGRYIVTLNGVLAEDIPSLYNHDWRKIFHYLPNEKVPLRMDGRGDVEILWQDNKVLDTMLSRFADDGILATYRKPWLKATEKDKIEDEGYSTNPLKPGYYQDAPPFFATSQSNPEYLKGYDIYKNGIKESLAVNNVTRGESSFSGESGAHAEALINQNTIMVTGELNQNLNDFIEEIVETRIEFWKQFYVEPRAYVIDGQEKELVLAEYLRQMPVEDKDGNVTYKEIKSFQVAVRPDSNFPNRTESEINILTQLSTKTNEEGMPLVPSEMILDYIAKMFPSLGRNGKYRKDSQLLALGRQKLAEQEQEQKQQEESAQAQGKPLEDIKRKVQNKLTTQAANTITGQGESNG